MTLDDRILHLYHEQNLSAASVSKMVGLSCTQVQRILNNNGRLRTSSEAMKLAWELGRTAQPYERTPSIRVKISQNTKRQFQEKGHPFQGRHHSEEAKAKMRANIEHHRKVGNYWRGRQRDPHQFEIVEHKRSQAYLEGKWIPPMCLPGDKGKEIRAKVGVATAQRWQDPYYREQVTHKMLKSRRPTDIEQVIISIIEKYSLPYKYTGDGSFLVGNLNPDFVNINGRKEAVDIFGDHWHTLDEIPSRKMIFAEYGWKLIIIWGHEIKELPEDKIASKLMRRS